MAWLIIGYSFACIVPTLIIGGFAERVKFLPCLLFSIFWSLLIYAPITHMVWSDNGILHKMHVLDFAGGLVVHVTALDAFGIYGIAGIYGSIIVGLFARKELINIEHVNMWNQILGTLVVIAYSAIISYLLIKIINKFFGFRVDIDSEIMGLDITQHGEKIG